MRETEDREAGGAGRREPFGYYYDDGTGYEIYRPEEDAEPAEESNFAEAEAGKGGELNDDASEDDRRGGDA
jgi:hypothetical protein